MVKHIVMWKLKEEAEGASRLENLRTMKQMLESLKDRIPFLRSIEVGINFNSDPGAYDIVLATGFNDRRDLEAYQNHPDHKRVADFIGRVREHRAVVDFEEAP